MYDQRSDQGIPLIAQVNPGLHPQTSQFPVLISNVDATERFFNVSSIKVNQSLQQILSGKISRTSVVGLLLEESWRKQNKGSTGRKN